MTESRFPNFNLKYEGRLIAIAEFQPEGAEYAYELAVRPPGVRVIALTEDKSQVWLTDEFRHEKGARDIRLPGGKVIDELGTYANDVANGVEVSEELVFDAARWESKEELGLDLTDPELVAMSPCGATVLWDLYYVVGTVADSGNSQELEDGEDIKPQLVSVEEAAELARTTMSEGRSAIQLLRVLDNL